MLITFFIAHHTNGCIILKMQIHLCILTLNPLTWKIWCAPNNACKWQVGFNSAFIYFFFLRFIAQQISEIHRVTKLRNCSFNQFALVVPLRASDREYTVLGSYEYSSEKTSTKEKHCGSWVSSYRRMCLGRLCMYFLYWRWKSAKE